MCYFICQLYRYIVYGYKAVQVVRVEVNYWIEQFIVEVWQVCGICQVVVRYQVVVYFVENGIVVIYIYYLVYIVQ